jgi:hypothetical protein
MEEPVTAFLKQTYVPPSYWAFLSFCVWLTFVIKKGWNRLDVWDVRQVLWGVLSTICFLSFLQNNQQFEVSHLQSNKDPCCETHWNLHSDA